MSAQFQFELVSPERLIASKSVTMVTVPGGEGDYGVLVGHAPMITTVRPGVIEVFGDNDSTVTERIFVAGGFAEVNAERCTVLAEQAIPVEQLDRTKLEMEAKSLHDELVLAKTDGERISFEAQLSVIRAKLQAILQ